MKFNASAVTKEIIGKPYKLGVTDCASIVVEFAEKSGMPFSKEWEGFTPENYAAFYMERPEQAKEVLCLWASTIGREIEPSRAFTGDVLIVRPKGHPANETPGVVIHAGQDLVLAVFEDRGVQLAPVRIYNVLKAYRWREKRKRKLITPRMEKIMQSRKEKP